MTNRECMSATACIEHAEAQEMVQEILHILNEPDDLHACIQRVLTILRTRTGVDAVGLRLQDGVDFPYFVQDGFPGDFLPTESTLVERGKDGGLCRDEHDHVRLECTCGLVISGKTDPSNPIFTKGGSFWINDSLPLLDLPSRQDPRLHPRNRCIHHGYASMALVPIRTREQIVGLIQLNDKRKGRFTLDTIETLEGIAAHIGSALIRKQLEAELKRSREALRALLGSIEQAREVERAHIARDMHDDLGQNLTAIKMDMRWIARALGGEGKNPDPAAIRARVAAAIEVVDATMVSVQELSASLRPSLLDSFGVAAALRSEIRRFQARSGIVCRTSLTDALPAMPPPAAMGLFRICQECLTNIARHSGATRAGVRMGIGDGNVVLRVHDNGTGIPLKFIDDPASLGLLGMTERAAALGGQIRFRRGKRHGTLVTVTLPMPLAVGGES